MDKQYGLGWNDRRKYKLVSDERFCDGLYFAMSLRLMRKFMKNPKVLEKTLDKKNEDVD